MRIKNNQGINNSCYITFSQNGVPAGYGFSQLIKNSIGNLFAPGGGEA
ncbi:hypothetical protein H6F98_00940 [Microcoleus sp. FACHB-SPT15]|nr:hypothetical protein [Microcoleus sp. FACHB-SPT15]MBD1804040.1 hypothetical protein [Microcoleus sp. FACHB-SPT15]